jgi:hypothetical protein
MNTNISEEMILMFKKMIGEIANSDSIGEAMTRGVIVGLAITGTLHIINKSIDLVTEKK